MQPAMQLAGVWGSSYLQDLVYLGARWKVSPQLHETFTAAHMHSVFLLLAMAHAEQDHTRTATAGGWGHKQLVELADLLPLHIISYCRQCK